MYVQGMHVLYDKGWKEPLGGTSSRCQPMTFYIKRIWNMDKQLPGFCLTFGGISTGIQIHHHVIMFRITNGLPLGTSNTDSWRLKPSIRCQLLVDRSELYTNAILNFLNLFSKRPREKRKGEKSITVINFLEFNVFHPEKQARLSWKLGNAQFTAHHTPDCRRGRHLGFSGGVV